jgi:hypothetical protein
VSGNDNGTYWTTLEAMMRAFDELPPSVRRALANAVFDWATPPLLREYHDGKSPRKIIKDLARWEREELELERELDRLRERGVRRPTLRAHPRIR